MLHPLTPKTLAKILPQSSNPSPSFTQDTEIRKKSEWGDFRGSREGCLDERQKISKECLLRFIGIDQEERFLKEFQRFLKKIEFSI